MSNLNIKLTFTTKVNSYDGKWSTNLAIGEFNGDGLIDFVFASMSFASSVSTTALAKNPIHIMIQNPDGSFADQTNTLAPINADVRQIDHIVTADINKDGITDIFIANGGADTPSGWAGDTSKMYVSSNGLLQLQQTPAEKVAFWHYVNVDDVNRDGKPDLFFINPSAGNPIASLLLINKDGILIDSQSLLPPALINPVKSLWKWNPAPGSLTTRQDHYTFQISELIDVNGDNYPDLVVFPHEGDSEFIFMNDGTGNFSNSTPIQIKVSFAGGKAAYAYADFAYNQTTRTWSPQMTYNSEYVFYDALKMDVNNDGSEDIVAISTYDQNIQNNLTGAVNQTAYHQNTYIQILINNGNGLVDETAARIQQPALVNLNYAYYAYIHAVDLNNDGFKDLMLARSSSVNPNSNEPGWTGQPDTIFYLNDGHGHFTKTVIPNLPNSQYTPVNVNGKLALLGITNYEYDKTGNKIISVWSTDQPWTTGADGNDFLYSTPANDVINGGGGLDTFIADGRSTVFKLAPNLNNNQWVVADDAGLRGNDTLTNVERLQFSDSMVALDIAPTDHAGSVYMLYQATFNRKPDAAGLGYWINAVDKGADITKDVAAAFVKSGEFIAKYGANPTNASYVDNLYQNVLHRAGDTGGVAYWNKALNDGTVTKAAALAAFATLPEGASNVAADIASGIAYTQWVG